MVFTIAVATGPLILAAAVEGARSLDGGLIRMAEVCRVPFAARLLSLHAAAHGQPPVPGPGDDAGDARGRWR